MDDRAERSAAFVLPNGLRVVLEEDHRVPIIAIDLSVGVGGRDDPAGKSGLAHLAEHLRFARGRDTERRIAIGATAFSAQTTIDRTTSFMIVSPGSLERAIQIERDGLLEEERFRDEDFGNERAAVLNEWREGENISFSRANAVQSRILYGGTPRSGNVIGTFDSISAVTRLDAQRFLEKFYVPSNATLSIVGDISVRRARALVETAFAPLRKVPRPEHLEFEFKTPTQTVTVDDPLAPFRLSVFSWQAPDPCAKDGRALELAMSILASRIGRRLGDAAIVTGDIDYHVFSAASLRIDERESLDRSLIDNVVADEVRRASSEDVDASSLDREIRSWLEADFREVDEGILERAKRLQREWFCPRDEVRDDRSRTRDVTAAAIRSAADRYLSTGFAESLSIPSASAEKSSVNATEITPRSSEFRAGVTDPPVDMPRFVPDLREFALPGGLDVFLLRNPQSPLVRFRILLPESRVPNSTPAGICARYWTRVPIPPGANLTGDFQGRWLEGVAPRTSAAEALAAAFLALRDPRTNEDGLAWEKKNYRHDVRLLRSRPKEVRDAASLYFREGREVPDESSVDDVSIETCRALASRLDLETVVLVVEGDLAEQEFRRSFAPSPVGWKRRAGASAPPTNAIASLPGDIVLLDVPGASMAEVEVFRRATSKVEDDQIPLIVLANVLAGRLAIKLRHEFGLSYQVRTTLEQSARGPVLSSKFATSPSSLLASLDALEAELSRVRRNGVESEEFERMRRRAPIVIATVFASPADALEATTRIARGYRPSDWYQHATARFAQVTKLEVQAEAEKYLRPDAEKIVVVGDRRKILGPLQSFASKTSRKLVVNGEEPLQMPPDPRP